MDTVFRRVASGSREDCECVRKLNLSEGPVIEYAASEIIGAEADVDLQSGAILSTDLTVSKAALEGYACVGRLEPTIGRTTVATDPSAVAEPDGDQTGPDGDGGKRKRNRAPRGTQSKRRRLARDRTTTG